MSPKRGIPFNELDLRADDITGGEVGTTARYLVGATTDSDSTETSEIADRLTAGPFLLRQDTVVDRIGVRVVTAQVSGSTRIGIYESLANGLPGALILDAGAVDTSTTGFKEATISLALPGPRMYWTAFVQAVSSVGLRSRNGGVSIGFGTGGDAAGATSVKRNFTFAALPDPWGTPTTFSTDKDHHLIWLRVV